MSLESTASKQQKTKRGLTRDARKQDGKDKSDSKTHPESELKRKK